MVLTFVLAALGWVLFRSQSIGEAMDFYAGMVGGGWHGFNLPMRAVAFVAAMLAVEWLQRGRGHGLDMSGVRYRAVRYTCYLAVLAVIFMYGVFNETFIYFQF